MYELFEIGFAVAFGVLIDTFLVRSIAVPALTWLFGERSWWPSRARPARALNRSRRGGESPASCSTHVGRFTCARERFAAGSCGATEMSPLLDSVIWGT